jgi:hypothetical protein
LESPPPDRSRRTVESRRWNSGFDVGRAPNGPELRPSVASANGLDDGKETLDWDADLWRHARDAWHERGLREPPSRKQLGRLAPILRAFPMELDDWIRDAPNEGRSTYGIIAFVEAEAEQARGERALVDQFGLLTEEEQAEWYEREQGLLGGWYREARGSGKRLVDLGDENVFRTFLRQHPTPTLLADEL